MNRLKFQMQNYQTFQGRKEILRPPLRSGYCSLLTAHCLLLTTYVLVSARETGVGLINPR